MRARLTRLKESLRASLWTMPSAAVVAAVSAGLMVSGVEAGPEHPLAWFAYPGGVEGARGLLQVIAGSMITVTSLTFTLTVVVLQMAASQYSPRLLRTFVSDLGNQAVLAIFLSTFAFSLTVLPSVRSPTEDKVRFVPNVGVTLALLLALASLGGLVYFIHHIATQVQISSIVEDIAGETTRLIREKWREDGAEREPDTDRTGFSGPSETLHAERSGFIEYVAVEPLVDFAAKYDLRIRVDAPPGSWVDAGNPLLTAFGARSELDKAIDQVQIGSERTMQQDVAFGLRVFL